jgi:DNA gyrase subunit B
VSQVDSDLQHRPDLQRRFASQAGSSTIDNTYNAAHLLVLEGLEAVRKRPGMYIGSTDTRGLMQCLWEIIDNGVDEALAGAAKRIEVTLHPDDSAEVHDDGRGIPVDKEPKTGLPGVEVVYTHLHAGGKFGGGSYVATGGLHGVGASVVNALSSRLDVDVDRSPSQQGISFRRGAAGVFDGEGPRAAFTPKSGLTRKGKRVAKGRTGTRVRFWPDRQIFTKDARFVFDDLVTRARQTSYIVPSAAPTLARRSSATTAGSRSSPSTSPPVSQ